MKTTIDIPEPLYRKIKIRAAEQGISLRELVVKAVERDYFGTPESAPSSVVTENGTCYMDDSGIPVLRRRETVAVTDEVVNQLREKEGI